MDKFTISYRIRFTQGLLEGIETEMELTYPMSRLEKTKAEFDEDIRTQKVYTTCSRMKYIIMSYVTSSISVEQFA